MPLINLGPVKLGPYSSVIIQVKDEYGFVEENYRWNRCKHQNTLERSDHSGTGRNGWKCVETDIETLEQAMNWIKERHQ